MDAPQKEKAAKRIPEAAAGLLISLCGLGAGMIILFAQKYRSERALFIL
jgi:hypothetical protein